MTKIVRIKDLVVYHSKGITPKYVKESSIIVLNQKCIRNNRVDISLSQYIDESKEYSSAKFLQPGDILINSTGQGTAGRVSFIDQKFKEKKILVDSHILVLRTHNYYEAQCLNYFLFSKEKLLQTYLDGSTGQGEFDKVRLFGLQVPFSRDLLQQKAISKFISAIDDKIELNNKINAQLEAIAKTIYDYWFVQFDFPDANGKPYRSSGGKMVYNETLKRQIPEGWQVKSIANFIAKDKNGDWGKEASEGNYTLQVECVRGTDINGLNGNEGTNCPKRFILDKNKEKILEPYDIVVEISGGSPIQSTGRLGFITEELLSRFDNPLICSNFCKCVSLKNSYSFYYFVYTWNRLYNSNILFGYEGKTSGIKNLLFESFTSNYKIVGPSKELQKKFFDIIDTMEKQKQTNLKQNQTLSSVRDWLLPMLMNGQVTVAEAYEHIDEVINMAAEPDARYNPK